VRVRRTVAARTTAWGPRSRRAKGRRYHSPPMTLSRIALSAEVGLYEIQVRSERCVARGPSPGRSGRAAGARTSLVDGGRFAAFPSRVKATNRGGRFSRKSICTRAVPLLRDRGPPGRRKTHARIDRGARAIFALTPPQTCFMASARIWINAVAPEGLPSSDHDRRLDAVDLRGRLACIVRCVHREWRGYRRRCNSAARGGRARQPVWADGRERYRSWNVSSERLGLVLDPDREVQHPPSRAR